VVSGKESAPDDVHDSHEWGDRADTRPKPVVLDERGADDWMSPLERYPLSVKRLLVPAPDDSLVALLASQLVTA
jgi:hypothetical protein